MPLGQTIGLDQLSQYFHLPINDVAKELGVCATVLKKICRKNGIPRWPHRKIKSLDRMIATLEAAQAKNPEDQERIKQEITALKNKKEFLMQNPNVLAAVKPSSIKKPAKAGDRNKNSDGEANNTTSTTHTSHPSLDEFSATAPFLYPMAAALLAQLTHPAIPQAVAAAPLAGYPLSSLAPSEQTQWQLVDGRPSAFMPPTKRMRANDEAISSISGSPADLSAFRLPSIRSIWSEDDNRKAAVPEPTYSLSSPSPSSSSSSSSPMSSLPGSPFSDGDVGSPLQTNVLGKRHPEGQGELMLEHHFRSMQPASPSPYLAQSPWSFSPAPSMFAFPSPSQMLAAYPLAINNALLLS